MYNISRTVYSIHTKTEITSYFPENIIWYHKHYLKQHVAQACTNSTFTTTNGNKNCVLNSEFLECIVDYNLCSQ